MELKRGVVQLRSALVLLATGSLQVAVAGPLPALNIDLSQTTVSGISSGAFMAVQFSVAHSAAVQGVAATAGGPYFCAGKDSWAGAGVSAAIARCMQGDPSYPAKPITSSDLDNMSSSARAWASKGLIDPVSNLQKQKVWIFHGYNDGIVKKPVSDALYQWYSGFTPAAQIFYKDELKAAHSQISAACSTGQGSCQPCATTGGDFINTCTNDQPSALPYDAAGAALQQFYGPLNRTATSALQGTMQTFDQSPYTRQGGSAVIPLKISMANSGYLYVPADCAAGSACRLHVAFHGCQQQAEKIGTAFISKAGFNEWADANHIVVLYPQTTAALAPPATPFNPEGCWDWWGYNDYGYSMTGHYATQDGDQIGTVWRMAQQLAAGAKAPALAPTPTAAPQVSAIDASDNQVSLTWTPVSGASAYRVFRNGQAIADTTARSWVDNSLTPQTAYSYSVSSLDSQGQPGPSSASVSLQTGKTAPACDPYFSLAKNKVVTKNNVPTTATCP